MNQNISVCLLPTRNTNGQALADLVQQLCNELAVAVRIINRATPTDFVQACISDDVVILDASIEDGHNYDIAIPQGLDHVLVVGRTYLPLNFYGLREGGTPDYPSPLFQSNQEIIAWLRIQLADMLPHLPRSADSKNFLGHFFEQNRSLKVNTERRKAAGQIFISYRSRYYAAVKNLQLAIEQNGRTVFCLPPGKLVYENEVLSEMRHWQLVSSIDWPIAAAEEVWVYNTNDYLHSWWTQAELVTLTYRYATEAKVRIVDPSSNRFHNAPAGYFPKLSEEQRDRMARWYANCDPAEMGPESMMVWRMLSRIPIVNWIPFVKDHVWSEEFWEYPLLPCQTCKARQPLPQQIDVDAFLWLKFPGLVKIHPKLLARGLETGVTQCPVCGSTYHIHRDPYSRYLWIPPHAQIAPRLIEYPIYRVSS